jgi:DNA segregation ATPase FtsK/SpoIIIE, S-DNA-T family
MHVTAGTESAAQRPDSVDAISARIDAASAKLTALGHEWSAAERAWRDQRAATKTSGDSALAQIAAEQAQVVGDSAEQVHASLQQRRARWLERVAAAGVRLRRGLREQHDIQLRAAEDSSPALPAVKQELSADARRSIERRRQMVQAELDQFRDQAERALDQLDIDCRKISVTAKTIPEPRGPLPQWELPRRILLIKQQLAAAENAHAEARGSAAYATCRALGMIKNHVLVGLPHIAFAVLAIYIEPLAVAIPYVAGSALLTQVLVIAWTTFRRWSAGKKLARARGMFERVLNHLDEFGALSDQDLMPELVLDRRVALIDDRGERVKAIEDATRKALRQAKEREQKLVERISARFAKTIDTVRHEANRSREDVLATLRARGAEQSAALERQLRDLDAAWERKRASFAERWQDSVAALRACADAAVADSAALQPAWDDETWQRWTPPEEYPSSVLIGSASMPIAEVLAAGGLNKPPAPADGDLAMPITLNYPAPASLLVRAGPRTRQAALSLVNTCVLRALSAFPPGRLRLTMIDPLGLGDSFAGLLAIADQEEGLLCGGILNDQSRIERGLEDLIAHLEKVIQKHLRGKYATIDDYNREAGEMQEALRLVVIADFPHGFSDRALEHLGALLRSGARCGVHFVIVHDDRKPIPDVVDLAWFRRSGLLVREVQGVLSIDRDGLHAWRFQSETPPPAELAARLLAEVCARAENAKRIEVPFHSIRPAAEAVWSLSAAQQISIPIGKRGADRLQHLELGRGTCQHVLIGGRTGSGKSTLFHVMVTSAALWYSPRELQFMLIDFKKGVEFRAFAAHHLPHAQVIAIESDREFGLSVLRHLDQELSRRGELFRKAGAQDLAAHRRSGDEYLPRVMLLIDEFQEFFTEDDVIARDAALLLDRFVRQGRAFGVHVVLGSQTLGGSYALAKSSIGQMGVRIVLPCNEADAHLLLHEENDISRLLTRPGDAVYNDRAGMVDGNSPFQVCWLPEEEEGNYLDEAASRAANESWQPSRPTIVFAGNSPALIEEEAELSELLARPYADADEKRAAWIGQSSSLKGATETSFGDTAGSNLLIIGQNRDSAAATCGIIALSLAARHRTDRLRLMALDGEDRDGPFARLHAQLAQTLPHAFVRHESRATAQAIDEIAGILARRQSGDDSDRTPIVLFIFALQRLRHLAPDEDLGLSGGASPAERFAEIVAKGPENHIHVVVWSDSVASTQRGLGRRALRDFDQRILFQMSASDSSELIDDDTASRLGLHTAILSVQSEGRREKFRPYSAPNADFLEGVRAALSRRLA